MGGQVGFVLNITNNSFPARMTEMQRMFLTVPPQDGIIVKRFPTILTNKWSLSSVYSLMSYHIGRDTKEFPAIATTFTRLILDRIIWNWKWISLWDYKNLSWVWGWDGKICPSGSPFVITRRTSDDKCWSWGVDFSISSS